MVINWIFVRSLKLPGIMLQLLLTPAWPFFTPTAESHGFSRGWLRLRSGCRTTKSRRLRSNSAKLSGSTGLPVGLHWQIGSPIRQDILEEKRADYGKEIVATLSQELTIEYGRGFSKQNPFNMIRFAEVFSDMKIVHELSAQLTWMHFWEIICLDNSLQRDFYAEMCRKNSEQIELLQLDKSGIKVAGYMTELPKRELIEQKLRKAVVTARKRLEAGPTKWNTEYKWCQRGNRRTVYILLPFFFGKQV